VEAVGAPDLRPAFSQQGHRKHVNALPKIVSRSPMWSTIILGATHPTYCERREAYRLSLELLAQKIGVQKNVIFYNRFVI